MENVCIERSVERLVHALLARLVGVRGHKHEVWLLIYDDIEFWAVGLWLFLPQIQPYDHYSNNSPW